MDVLLNDVKDVRTAVEEVNFIKNTFKGTPIEQQVEQGIEKMRREKMRELLS